MKRNVLFVLLLGLFCIAAFADDDQVSIEYLSKMHPMHTNNAGGLHKGNVSAPHDILLRFDTISSFTGHFQANGIDPSGNFRPVWTYSMIGSDPALGGTKTYNAPIVPVTLDLRNFDGSPRFVNGQPLVYKVSPAVLQAVLNSPVFSNTQFSSSPVPTQFTDAIHRAQFGVHARDDWHTLLAPVVKQARTMVLIRGTYRFALNPDGTCCAFVLANLDDFNSALFPSTSTFPPDSSSVIGAAEVAGDITPQDIPTFLFPNTFLYFKNDPRQCCVLGFHSLDIEIPRLYPVIYASWITPGILLPYPCSQSPSGSTDCFTDVTALSHEMAELFNDPFVGADGVHNLTPFWKIGNQCADILEDGDVIEGLDFPTFPITMNGMTYHPQNVALLPWFEFARNSFAMGNAYSFPDPTTLTSLSAPQSFNCGQ